MAASRNTVLKLYKDMLKEALKFSSYNFRMYALRRVRDSFRANAALSDEVEINNQLQFGKDNLKIMKRQTLIGGLYSAEKLVIENQDQHSRHERFNK